MIRACGLILVSLLLGGGGVQPPILVELVSVYDGDTITVTIPGWPTVIGHRIGVRLKGIDAPEIAGKCEAETRLALRARDALAALLWAARRVEIMEIERDKYFRLLAVVVADGKDAGKRQLAQGLARPYRGGRRESWCPASRP